MALFVSPAGEQLKVSYDRQTDSITLNLPDRSTARLLRKISGSGARYANDRLVYWEHQDEVSVWSNDVLIFKGTFTNSARTIH